jgi:MoaA/NifB/PqqE/SkfB family radical SAM enzyme
LCCEDMGRNAVLGNVNKHSIIEVWNSYEAKDILGKIFLGKTSDDTFPCKSCEFGISTTFRKIVKIIDHEWHKLLRCYV